MTARSICPDLIPESEEVAAMFEQALKLFARCHHIYDSCRVLKDREIDRLGEWNMNKLKATFYTYSFHNFRFIHQGVYVLLPDTLSSCHRNSEDAHAGRAYCTIFTKMAHRIRLHGGAGGWIDPQCNQPAGKALYEHAQPGKETRSDCTPTPPSCVSSFSSQETAS